MLTYAYTQFLSCRFGMYGLGTGKFLSFTFSDFFFLRLYGSVARAHSLVNHFFPISANENFIEYIYNYLQYKLFWHLRRNFYRLRKLPFLFFFNYFPDLFFYFSLLINFLI